MNPTPHPRPVGSPDFNFYAMLLLALVALAAVLAPLVYVLLLAAVIVQVTWPVQATLTRWCGGRSHVAAALTSTLVLAVLAAPVTAVLWLAVRETLAILEAVPRFLADGGVERWSAGLGDLMEMSGLSGASLEASIQQAVVKLSGAIGSGMPGLIGKTGRVLLDVGVFMMALFGMYANGPLLVGGIRDLVPLENRYVDRLLEVFQQFSSNVVMGVLVTGVAQGIVSAIAFWIAGVDPVVALGVATGVASIVPLVGATVVWLPTAITVAVGGSPGWALFIVAWSLGLTASVDNVIRPFVLRNGLAVSPILILLSVVGGIVGLGVKGLVLGPLVLLAFLTLFTFYRRDYLHRPELVVAE